MRVSKQRKFLNIIVAGIITVWLLPKLVLICQHPNSDCHYYGNFYGDADAKQTELFFNALFGSPTNGTYHYINPNTSNPLFYLESVIIFSLGYITSQYIIGLFSSKINSDRNNSITVGKLSDMQIRIIVYSILILIFLGLCVAIFLPLMQPKG